MKAIDHRPPPPTAAALKYMQLMISACPPPPSEAMLEYLQRLASAAPPPPSEAELLAIQRLAQLLESVELAFGPASAPLLPSRLKGESVMATKTVEISLKRPLVGHGGPITKVVVREPTFSEYLEIGDPYLVAMAPESKIPFMVEDKAALAAYVRILVVSPDPLVIEQGGMSLAREITGIVRGFFQPGAEADGASETSPTSSSSEPVKIAMR